MLNRKQKGIDHELKKRGFAGLEDANVTAQMGFCVRNHDHFRGLLMVIPPEKRQLAYNQLRPHLRFEAKPLDVYIAEAKQEAERLQLPIAHRTGPDGKKDLTVTDFHDYHNRPVPLEVLAERAILQADRDRSKKGVLLLTCVKCTREMGFPGRNRAESVRDAQLDGWSFQRVEGREEEVTLCPACRPQLVLA